MRHGTNHEFGVDPNVSTVIEYTPRVPHGFLPRTIITSLHLLMAATQISVAFISSWTISKIQHSAHSMSSSPITLSSAFQSMSKERVNQNGLMESVTTHLAVAPAICQTQKSGKLEKERNVSNLHLQIACLIIECCSKTHRE